MNMRYIRPSDDEWPTGLRDLRGSSALTGLHVAGKPLASTDRLIALVGTRRPTAAGVEITREFTRALVEGGFGIVSGLAVGIDAVAHETALRAGGYTVAVLGCGLDVDYPRRNRRLRDDILVKGTLLTEYEPGAQPLPAHFPERNRIVAALSSGVLIVEGGARSGALITARLGIDLNRSVWAVPGSVRNPMAAAPNELIRTGGAALVTDITHVFEELAPGLIWRQGTLPTSGRTLTNDEIDILMFLDDVPVAPEAIASRTDGQPGAVALTLSRLEVRGLVARRTMGYELLPAGARAREAVAGRV